MKYIMCAAAIIAGIPSIKAADPFRSSHTPSSTVLKQAFKYNSGKGRMRYFGREDFLYRNPKISGAHQKKMSRKR